MANVKYINVFYYIFLFRSDVTNDDGNNIHTHTDILAHREMDMALAIGKNADFAKTALLRSVPL